MSFVNSERIHINMLMGTVSTLNVVNHTKLPQMYLDQDSCYNGMDHESNG